MFNVSGFMFNIYMPVVLPQGLYFISLFLLKKENLDSTCRSALRKSNIKLTMRKHRSSKINSEQTDPETC